MSASTSLRQTAATLMLISALATAAAAPSASGGVGQLLPSQQDISLVANHVDMMSLYDAIINDTAKQEAVYNAIINGGINQSSETEHDDEHDEERNTGEWDRVLHEQIATDAFVAKFFMPDFAKVENATLTEAQTGKIIDWMIKERAITSVPACYRHSYDRGIGKIRNTCTGADEEFKMLKCVKKCAQTPYTMSDHGTLTCLQNECPSGYQNRGLICHYQGQKSYWVGFRRSRTCRAGFTKRVGTCWYTHKPSHMTGSAWDPMKWSYTRSRSSRAVCPSDKPTWDDSMCYRTPREGFTCFATACQEICQEGTKKCGAGMCTASKLGCASTILTMITSPLSLAMNIYTMGGWEASGGSDAVNTGASSGRMAQLSAFGSKLQAGASSMQQSMLQLTGTSAQAWQTTQTIASHVMAYGSPVYTAVTKTMTAAEQNIDELTNDWAAREFEKHFAPGSPNHRQVARNMGWMATILASQELAVALGTIAAGLADPTGVVQTFAAFNWRMCKQHQPMPAV